MAAPVPCLSPSLNLNNLELSAIQHAGGLDMPGRFINLSGLQNWVNYLWRMYFKKLLIDAFSRILCQMLECWTQGWWAAAVKNSQTPGASGAAQACVMRARPSSGLPWRARAKTASQDEEEGTSHWLLPTHQRELRSCCREGLKVPVRAEIGMSALCSVVKGFKTGLS